MWQVYPLGLGFLAVQVRGHRDPFILVWQNICSSLELEQLCVGLAHMHVPVMVGGEMDVLIIPFYLSPLTWCPLDQLPGELYK